MLSRSSELAGLFCTHLSLCGALERHTLCAPTFSVMIFPLAVASLSLVMASYIDCALCFRCYWGIVFDLVPSMLNHSTLDANQCLTAGAIDLDFCVHVFLAVEGQCGDMLRNLPLLCLLKFKDFVIKC